MESQRVRDSANAVAAPICQEGDHPIEGKVHYWNDKPICDKHFGDYHEYFVDSFMKD